MPESVITAVAAVIVVVLGIRSIVTGDYKRTAKPTFRDFLRALPWWLVFVAGFGLLVWGQEGGAGQPETGIGIGLCAIGGVGFMISVLLIQRRLRR